MLGNAEQRTEGMKKQAQELIELTYLSGYKKAEEDYYIQTEKDRESSYQLGIEVGRNEAWGAARKIMSQNDASWDMKEMKEIFGSSYSTDIMHDLSASEAIEKIREYEQKKQVDEDFKVGDVIIQNGVEAVVTWCNGEEWNGFLIKGEDAGEVGQTYSCISCKGWEKTGRTFHEIAEVLKKERSIIS